MKKYIPTAFTLGNLLCGFIAILVNDAFLSPLIIMLGAFLDVFDGMLARKLNVVSEMGKELDSLADLVSFGIAPAYLYAQLMPNQWFSYIGACAIIMGGALRLAKFNTKPASAYFQGLAIPSSGLFFSGLVFASSYHADIILPILSNSIVYIGLGVLMMMLNLSNLPMFSLKSLGINKTNKVMMSLLILGLIACMIISPTLAIPMTILWYIILATSMNVLGKV